MNIAQHVLTFGVRLYRWTLSPAKPAVFGPLAHCRYSPSCSEYALEAIRVHGALSGSWLALRRIGRCHPWGDCGHDPVPVPESEGRNPKSEGAGLVQDGVGVAVTPQHRPLERGFSTRRSHVDTGPDWRVEDPRSCPAPKTEALPVVFPEYRGADLEGRGLSDLAIVGAAR